MSITWNKRIVIPIGVVVLLAVSAALLVRQFNKPVRATTFATVGNAAVPSPPQPIPVANAYAKFSYPGSMQAVVGAEGPSGYQVATYSYKMANVVPWHLVITIDHLHEPGLKYDTAYLMRKDDPARYQVSTTTVDSNTFTVMTDTQAGGFNKAAFSLHGDLSADISLTGDDSSGDTTLAQAFQQVLQSWHWL